MYVFVVAVDVFASSCVPVCQFSRVNASVRAPMQRHEKGARFFCVVLSLSCLAHILFSLAQTFRPVRSCD